MTTLKRNSMLAFILIPVVAIGANMLPESMGFIGFIAGIASFVHWCYRSALSIEEWQHRKPKE